LLCHFKPNGKQAIMAQELLASARQTMKDTIAGQNSKKTNDLKADTKDVHDKSWRITSDSGTKQGNTDDWLSVVNEDHTGPMLLEDNFAREKV
jgi:catalase